MAFSSSLYTKIIIKKINNVGIDLIFILGVRDKKNAGSHVILLFGDDGYDLHLGRLVYLFVLGLWSLCCLATCLSNGHGFLIIYL